MHYQVIRVLVVLVVADVVADVVEQRGVGEDLPVVRVQPRRWPIASKSCSASVWTCRECGSS